MEGVQRWWEEGGVEGGGGSARVCGGSGRDAGSVRRWVEGVEESVWRKEGGLEEGRVCYKQNTNIDEALKPVVNISQSTSCQRSYTYLTFSGPDTN